MKIFKDINGKPSSKRYAGWLIIIVSLTLAFFSISFEVSETLILGMLSAGVGLIAVSTFEKKVKI